MKQLETKERELQRQIEKLKQDRQYLDVAGQRESLEKRRALQRQRAQSPPCLRTEPCSDLPGPPPGSGRSPAPRAPPEPPEPPAALSAARLRGLARGRRLLLPSPPPGNGSSSLAAGS